MADIDPTVGVVFDKLAGDGALADDVKDLVVGALLDDLDAAIGGEIEAPPRQPTPEDDTAPTRAYLGEVSVRGFRGIGPEVILPLQPGPGLTLVVGRNGSGKSSFAEAAELALTGECSRWANRKAKVWEKGWANLHATDTPRIEVGIDIDGDPGGQTIAGAWPDGEHLDAATWEVRDDTGATAPVQSLGWSAPMALYRPFLSYNELGSLLEEGPSKLYDALASILGLDALSSACERLTTTRTSRNKAAKETKDRAKWFATELATVDDERAQRAAACLKGTKWDLDTLTTLLLGDEAGPDTESTHLSRLMDVPAPDVDEVGAAADRLRSCVTAKDDLRGTDADRALRTAELLTAAADLHAAHGDQDCPVCGTGRLDGGRVAEIRAEADILQAQAGAARAADQQLRNAVEDARRLLAVVPASLAQAAAAGVVLPGLALARSAWERWLDAPDDDDPIALADHLEQAVEDVARATQLLSDAARRRHDELEDLWRPWATQLAAFLEDAEEAQAADALGKRLAAAEKWLQAVADEIRDERFEPVAAKVKETWAVLRQNSSVEIADVVLSGAKTRRRVEVKVNVDDVNGAALGVMSQGELHALALSLFVPRATLDDSPFRFLVIDDPVQAMDPARVDGLATLLADLAKTRQVVVFTHDDRLPDATRRLQLDATVIEVTRRPSSVVDVRVAGHPAYTYLDDAWGVAKSERVPTDVRRRVVPGLCRHAIEAACVDAARRKLIAASTSHDELEAALTDPHTLYQTLALALFGDADRSGDVLSWINGHWGKRAGDAVVIANKGAHGITGEFSAGHATDLISDTRAVVDQLVGL